MAGGNYGVYLSEFDLAYPLLQEREMEENLAKIVKEIMLLAP
jgi:hypothetical protein